MAKVPEDQGVAPGDELFAQRAVGGRIGGQRTAPVAVPHPLVQCFQQFEGVHVFFVDESPPRRSRGSRSQTSQTQGSTGLRYRISHRHIVIGTAAAAMLGAVLMLSSAGDGGRMPQDTLLAALATGTAPPVLDVRTTREYGAGHVPGATHVPYHLLWVRRVDLPADKAGPMVVYCSHGPRAGMAKLQLRALGYRNVRYLDGQMSGWKQRGLPLTTGPAP